MSEVNALPRLPIIWTPWSNEKNAQSWGQAGQYITHIQLATPGAQTGYRNRRWRIFYGQHVIAQGYTLGTADADEMIRQTFKVWGFDLYEVTL